MLHSMRKAVASISIDLPADDSSTSTSAACSLTERLIELFQRSAFAATWAIAEPGASPWTERLLNDPLGHELALLGERSWIGHSAGRTRFCHELVRRVAAAGQAGVRISTLALHGVDGVEVSQDLDLLVKQRISLVRSDATERNHRSAPGVHPQSVRFGVWRAPVAAIVTGSRGWWAGSGVWQARRAVRRVVGVSGFVHVVIDAHRMLAQQQSSLAGLQRLLHLIRQHELRGALEVAPLHQASARWIRPRTAAPSRSVLRHVA